MRPSAPAVSPGRVEQVTPVSSVIVTGVWTWLNSYRVWLAKLKVFLWPENWLEPGDRTRTRRRRR